MVKLFGVLMAISIMLVLLACAPRAAPVATPTPAAPQAALPLPAPVAPVISAEETAWQKVVAAAKKEGKTTVYSSRLVGDLGIYVGKGFKDRTGLYMDVIGCTAASCIERILAERRAGAPIASLLDAGVVEVFRIKADGLTQPIGYLPSLADGTAFRKNPFVDPEGHNITQAPSFMAPFVNTKLVKPGEEPKSYKDLLELKWNRKISMGAPDVDAAPSRLYYYLTKYAGLDDSYFRALGGQVVFNVSDRLSSQAVARGEMAISLGTGSTTMGPFALEGAPIKAIDMEEGVIGLQGSSLGLLKDAPHPNASRVFINWLFSQEGQTIYHKIRGTASFRKDVPSFEPLAVQIIPKKIIWTTAEEDMEVVKIQRSQVLKKLMTEK